MSHPFETLTPDLVQDALASVGLWGDGRLMPLNSYENRVYLAHLDEAVAGHSAVVLKFYRPERWSSAALQEEHDFAAELVAADVPVVAPLELQGRTLHPHGGFHFSVSPYKGGRRPELDNADVLEWTGRFLARLHSVGERQPFAHRPAISIQTYARESRDWLLTHDCVPLDVASRWAQTFEDTLTTLLACAPELDAKTTTSIANNSIKTSGEATFFDDFDLPDPAQPLTLLRLHGDCHPGNVLWVPPELPGGGPHFVDLDDARTGPAVQDLWMLLPGGSRQEQTIALSTLLDGYEQFRPFDRRELRLIEPLRTLRQLHYSAWLARRWADPAFPAAFPWFGSSAYWQGQIQQMHEQIDAMQSPPLVA